jgi:hypothetical protein
MTDRSEAYDLRTVGQPGTQTSPSRRSTNSVEEFKNGDGPENSTKNISDVIALDGSQPEIIHESRAVNESPHLAVTFSAIERRCPDFVSFTDWQQAVADGRKFLIQWGEQAEALGWTAQDLFGLHDPYESPEPLAANYRRLSRYDATGLIWFLHGRPIVALDADSAVIGTAGGQLTFHRHPQTKKVVS